MDVSVFVYLEGCANVVAWFVVADFFFAIFPWFVIWELNMKRKEKIDNLRTAAFVSALNKISSAYVAMGVFP